MLRSTLRDRLQPALEQDFDSLYDEFVAEHGREDPSAFVLHLMGFGLIPEALARDLRQDIRHADAAPPRPAGDGSATWVDDSVLDAPTGARVSMPRSATPAPPPRRKTPEPKPKRVTVTGAPQRIEQPRRRTLYRKASDGSLSEEDDVAPVSRPAQLPPSSSRYEFVSVVGEGAMGRVHLAEDTVLRRRVAFKQMSDDVANDPALAAKFTSEARITAQLDHPNIVPVYDVDGDTAYTMKLVGGRTLQDILAEARDDALGARTPRHTPANLLELFLRVCDGVAYAHARGILHRDLKPENIMVGAFGEVYVMDWGIARPSRAEADRTAGARGPYELVHVGGGLDEGDLIVGTPGYMSPEQASGQNDALDGRSDAYALGLLLFEILALRPAVTGRTALAQVIRHQEGETDALAHVGGRRLPKELVAIVHKATRKDPDDRYPDVLSLAEDVRRYLRGDAVLARPDGPIDRLFRWMAKHRETTAFIVTAIAMTTVVLVFTIVVWTQLQLAASEAREQRLSTLLSTVARQASSIDGQFLKYEGLLSVLATSATDRLFGAGGDLSRIHAVSAFEAPSTVPTLDAPRYKRPVSLTELAFHPAPGDGTSLPDRQMATLGPLSRRFYEVLLRSHSEEAATWTTKRAQRAITEVGVPVAYAWIGTEEGVYAVYPGHGGLPAGFDHRKLPSYEMAIGHHGPVWGAPTSDPSGVGLTLSCAQGLFDAEDKPIGVVGIDVTFDYLIDRLLVPAEVAGREGVETFLLDPTGRVVVQSARRSEGAPDLAEFGVPAVVRAVKEKRSGYVRIADASPEQLVVYNRMGSIGWYYVVTGPVGTLMAR